MDLSVEEIDLIRYYVGRGHDPINQYLRSRHVRHVPEDTLHSKISALSSLLEKLPRYDGEKVIRTDLLGTPEVYQKWFKKRIGKTIKRPEFLSCYKSTLQPVNLEIYTMYKNSKAVDIESIVGSFNFKLSKMENEVLFQKGTTFIIEDIVDETVILSETNDNPGLVFTTDCYYQDDEIMAIIDKLAR